MNGTLVKNKLIFDFAAGSLGPAKSLFASTYLYLNSKAAKINSTFESLLGEDLINIQGMPISKIKYTDCISGSNSSSKSSFIPNATSPISKLLGPFDKLNWKQVYKGFNEFIPNIEDKDELKLIKMDPGASVPLHSHGGKEYILVLSGSFCDEFGKYNKGDIQINDQKIKHTPIACKEEGCICLSITEQDVIFYGRFGSFFKPVYFYKIFF